MFTKLIYYYIYIFLLKINNKFYNYRLRKKQSNPDLSVKVCLLCGTSAQYMTKYSMWKDLEKVFIEMHCVVLSFYISYYLVE